MDHTLRGRLAVSQQRSVPVFEQVEQREVAPVAIVTDAQADLLVTTLLVHGIEATAPVAAAFPSLDWAEGRAISVRIEDVAAAAELLRDLGHVPLPGAQ